MAKKDNICSLYVMNLEEVSRTLAGSILRPYRGGLVHFKVLDQVRYALSLQDEKIIDIQTKIPEHIYAQLTFQKSKQEEVKEPEVPVSEETKEPETPAGEVQNDVSEPQLSEEITPDETEHAPEVITSDENEENPPGELFPIEGDAEEPTKPEWYLDWEQVEDMTKAEIQKWVADHKLEDLKLAKSWDAGKVKAAVHEYIAEQFEDHVAPETEADGE